MAELTEAQKALRDKLLKDAAEAEKARAERGYPIPNPDKYSGPIGFDDQGRPFQTPPSDGDDNA